jgi:hypothetical protein
MLLVDTPIAYVLVKYYPHGHHLVGGELLVYHIIICLLLPSTHHHHLPLLFAYACKKHFEIKNK